MTKADVAELARISRSFGKEAAAAKADILDRLEAPNGYSARDLRTLHDTLCFVLACPDDRTVRSLARRVAGKLRGWLDGARGGSAPTKLEDTGFPGSSNVCSYSYPVTVRLQRLFPEDVEIDWDALEDPDTVQSALGLLVAPGECQGLDDIYLSVAEWIERAKPARPARTDLAFVLQLFAESNQSEFETALMFESCALPIRFSMRSPGSGRGELEWPVPRIHYHKGPRAHDRVAVEAQIRAPFAATDTLSRQQAQQLTDLALQVLCTRNIEIRPLARANPRDVVLRDCGRGIAIALIGAMPDYREPLESTYTSLVLSNGIPVGYGPASVCLGCCEMGLNVFPEFRGLDMRFIYAQLMRVIHHELGGDYFFLTAYGMGELNPAAIQTGAFWFYRKLGFHATNPEVEELALAEEARMRRQPGYRSDRRMLRRLSHTEAYLDLTGGASRPLDLAPIGLRQSQMIARRFGGSRRRAQPACVAEAARLLGVKPPDGREQHAWDLLAPILCMIPGVEGWSGHERRAMRRIIRAKAALSERETDRMIRAHAPFVAALRQLADQAGAADS